MKKLKTYVLSNRDHLHFWKTGSECRNSLKLNLELRSKCKDPFFSFVALLMVNPFHQEKVDEGAVCSSLWLTAANIHVYGYVGIDITLLKKI